MNQTRSVVMLGATGAVGNIAAMTMVQSPLLSKLTLLGRRVVENITAEIVNQHVIDISSSATYSHLLIGHDTAVCTLGVGQPSKVRREEFVRIDKEAVIEFAKSCKHAGVRHFILLSSVGVNSGSNSFYLRIKGQLEDELKTLKFNHLSLFHPSMIMTPTNRYGFSQAVALKLIPFIDPLLIGSLKQFRSVKVEHLGRAMAVQVFETTIVENAQIVEVLDWSNFQSLNADN
jgi:uncharacterized protein YbjT (DUF2867 family)